MDFEKLQKEICGLEADMATTRLTPAQIIRNMQCAVETEIDNLILKFEKESGVHVISIKGEEDEDGNLITVIALSAIDSQDVEDEE